MGKIIVFNLITLDGYFAGEDGNIDWHKVDEDFNKFAIEQTAEFGALLFGRITYEIFEDFWPKALKDPATSDDDRKVAQLIEDMEKIVFSTTRKNVTWNNSRLFDEINKEEILELKNQPGKDMAVFGSGQIVQQLTNLDLVDEYRLMYNPVVLGKGKPMFKDVKALDLKLTNMHVFSNGNALLTYQVSK